MSMHRLPNEIIQHLLYHLPPEDNLASFQLLSRRMNRLANGHLLWRHHCQSIRYWSQEHNLQQKLLGPPTDADWKGLFVLRKRRNTRVAKLFDGILASQVGRIARIEQICVL